MTSLSSGLTEDAGGDVAGSLDLVRWRFGSDTCSDTDEGHREEGSQFVNVGVVPDVAGLPAVGKCVAERSSEPFEVGLDMLGRAGVERGAFDGCVAK